MDFDALTRYISHLKGSALLIVHDKPDADCLGSAFALGLYLKNKGVDVAVACTEDIPHRLTFLPHEGVPFFTGETLPEKYAAAVTAVMLDVGSSERTKTVYPRLSHGVDLCIDHHGNYLPEAAAYFIDPESAATAEILMDFLWNEGAVTNDIAYNLYAAISSDTGGFKFGNATPETYRRAADLIETFDFPHDEINRCLFDCKSRNQVKAEAYALSHIQFLFDGKLSLIEIDTADYEKLGILPEDTDTFSQLCREIEGVIIGVSLKKKTAADGSFLYKCSLRSNGGGDISQLARCYAGGGHSKAAGCTVKEADKEQFFNDIQYYL